MSIAPAVVAAAGAAVLAYAYNAYLRSMKPVTVLVGSTEASTFVLKSGLEISLPEADTALATSTSSTQPTYVAARMIQEGWDPNPAGSDWVDTTVQKFKEVEDWAIENWSDPQVVADQPHLHNRGINSI